ncbi:alpha/beta hydrolase [Chryseobacterium sp. JJR-5R]|uniref:alpha/beta hydrolase n=1 Tax=Chryseobacterium sp. JJR-5R TaxID=3093923 RepID=UPI002A761D02|nr:alpha/beta hydrolase [Chryseobacterium sp. JJR-5R]WPO84166.1 alpha/beta hydrolase [Chryseobacterium sp. JJR-5R]
MTNSKTTHLFAKDFQHITTSDAYADIAKQFLLLDINKPEQTKTLLSKLNSDLLVASLSNSPSPSGQLVAPQNDSQPAVDLYTFYPEVKTQGKIPVIYFMHGSGYLIGNSRQQNQSLFDLANETGAVVISVGYRLAGEDPYPADINDAYHGLAYVFDNADELGFDKKKVIIMGESAGGGLAARLALKVRDLGIYHLIGQILTFPMLDYRTGSEHSLYHNPFAGEFIWLPEFNQLAWQMLKGGKEIPAEEMPYYSASMATDLSGLPRTFITVGSLDLFVNEDIDYANRLISSGVQTDLLVLNGVPHGIENNSPSSPEAKRYIETRTQIITTIFSAIE